MTMANTPGIDHAFPLGIDTLANGENESDPASGVCISIRRAPPQRLARHDQAGDNTERHDVRALRKPADLLEPATHERHALKSEREHARRQRREPRAEQERHASATQHSKTMRSSAAQRMLRQHAR